MALETTVTTTDTTVPWYAPLAAGDSELIGHIQNKGWGALKPEELALNAAKAHLSAEKLVGVPANQIIRLPQDVKDEAGWKSVYSRLGVPNDPNEYDFKTIKRADGTDLDEQTVTVLRDAAVAGRLSKDAAQDVAKRFVKLNDDKAAAELALYTDALNKEKDTLKKNWGPNFDANMIVAKGAVAALGIKAEAITALEKAVGYSAVMDMFRTIGAKTGEDTFVNSNTTSGGIMSREQALARKAELENDTAWVKRYLAGDAMANREMVAITKLIVGDDTAESNRRANRR